MYRRKKTLRTVGEIIGLIACVFMLIPFWIALINSFKTKEEAALVNIALPTTWHIIENYREMCEGSGVFTALRNSVMLTVPTVLLEIFGSSMISFIIQRRNDKSSNMLQNMVMLGMFLPIQMIPTYFICHYLHLKSFAATACVLLATGLPMAMFLYTGYLKSVPRELDESAMLDGCTCFQLFWKIIFPLLKPMTVTVFIINFMNIWNDFGTTIYFLNSSQNYTLPLTIYNFFGTHSSDWNLVFANVVVVSMPVIIVYFLAQNQIVAGMTAGAVKG